MTEREMLDMAQAYSDLGSSVQEQAQDLLHGRDPDLNPNAVKAILDFAREYSLEDLRERAEQWLAREAA